MNCELIRLIQNFNVNSIKRINEILDTNVKKLKMSLKLGEVSKTIKVDPETNELLSLYVKLDSDIASVFGTAAKNILIYKDMLFIKSSKKIYTLLHLRFQEVFIYDTTGFFALKALHTSLSNNKMTSSTFLNFVKGTDLEEPAIKMIQVTDKILKMTNEEKVKFAIEKQDVYIERIKNDMIRSIYEYRKEQLPEDILKWTNKSLYII